MNINVICVIFLIQWDFSVGQTEANLKSLLTYLFTTNSYDTNVRPSTDQTLSTTVSVDFYLAGISSLDEVTETLTTRAYLNITWKDELLTWSPSSYGNINSIYYSQDNVWKPPIVLQNGFTKLSEMGSTLISVNVDSNGVVTWLPFEIFQSKCPVDTSYFPFDAQTCSITFVCWGTKLREINMTLGAYGFQLYDDFSANGEWEVLKLMSNVDADMGNAEITFTVTIKRKSGYFVVNVILPVVLLSVLNLFTFVIPADGGERISYAITVWLTFAVFLTIVGTILPKKSSNTSVFEVYLILMTMIGSLVVLISAIQIRLVGYSNEDMKIPNFLIRMVVFLKRKKQIKYKSGENAATNEIEMNTSQKEKNKHQTFEDNAISWKTVVSTVDFVLFWVLLVVVFIITSISMVYISVI